MIQISNLVTGQPFEGGVASVCTGIGIIAGGVVLFLRDGNAVGICVRDSPDSVLQQRSFNGIGVIGYRTVLQVNGCFNGIDLRVRNHNVVIDHIVPGVGIFDMEGVNGVGHDVGERLFRVLIQRTFVQ